MRHDTMSYVELDNDRILSRNQQWLELTCKWGEPVDLDVTDGEDSSPSQSVAATDGSYSLNKTTFDSPKIINMLKRRREQPNEAQCPLLDYEEFADGIQCKRVFSGDVIVGRDVCASGNLVRKSYINKFFVDSSVNLPRASSTLIQPKELSAEAMENHVELFCDVSSIPGFGGKLPDAGLWLPTGEYEGGMLGPSSTLRQPIQHTTGKNSLAAAFCDVSSIPGPVGKCLDSDTDRLSNGQYKERMPSASSTLLHPSQQRTEESDSCAAVFGNVSSILGPSGNMSGADSPHKGALTSTLTERSPGPQNNKATVSPVHCDDFSRVVERVSRELRYLERHGRRSSRKLSRGDVRVLTWNNSSTEVPSM